MGGEAPVGVFVRAGGWRVDVCEERALAAGRLGKGMLEFFVHVLWRVRAKLEEPVAVLSPEVGAVVGEVQAVAIGCYGSASSR